MTARSQVEEVVLLDEGGRSLGTAPKSEVHHDRTPLHLAFSCYLFDGEGRLLLTRRALHKRTWPGVWTNSFCGHPAPGEDVTEAVRRRGEQELGVRVQGLRLVLPAFRYEAAMADGTRENEMCPVFVATTTDSVAPLADEVDAVEWVPWESFSAEVAAGQRDVSPWCVEQVLALRSVAGDGVDFPAADPAGLPAAAREGVRPV